MEESGVQANEKTFRDRGSGLIMKKKTIKWNKGLFRVWIVLTIVWFIICTLRIIEGVQSIHGFSDLELFGVFVIPPILLAIIFFICPPVLKWVKAGFK